MLKLLKLFALIVVTSINADLEPYDIDFDLLPEELG